MFGGETEAWSVTGAGVNAADAEDFWVACRRVPSTGSM
jgi:hypothetical protein